MDHLTELYELAGAQCEGVLTPQQAVGLEELVLADAGLRRRCIRDASWPATAYVNHKSNQRDKEVKD